VGAGLEFWKKHPALMRSGYSRIIMGDTYLLAFITDPHFLRDLIAQIIILTLACVLAGWSIYKLLRKLAPNVKRLYQVR
jgi:hypothetical protein